MKTNLEIPVRCEERDFYFCCWDNSRKNSKISIGCAENLKKNKNASENHFVVTEFIPLI